jgi:hypothetical protein
MELCGLAHYMLMLYDSVFTTLLMVVIISPFTKGVKSLNFTRKRDLPCHT